MPPHAHTGDRQRASAPSRGQDRTCQGPHQLQKPHTLCRVRRLRGSNSSLAPSLPLRLAPSHPRILASPSHLHISASFHLGSIVLRTHVPVLGPSHPRTLTPSHPHQNNLTPPSHTITYPRIPPVLTPILTVYDSPTRRQVTDRFSGPTCRYRLLRPPHPPSTSRQISSQVNQVAR